MTAQVILILIEKYRHKILENYANPNDNARMNGKQRLPCGWRRRCFYSLLRATVDVYCYRFDCIHRKHEFKRFSNIRFCFFRIYIFSPLSLSLSFSCGFNINHKLQIYGFDCFCILDLRADYMRQGQQKRAKIHMYPRSTEQKYKIRISMRERFTFIAWQSVYDALSSIIIHVE